MEEVPLPEGPLRALDEQRALAEQDEECLLLRLGVVEARRLAGFEHVEADAELRKLGLGALEAAQRPARVPGQPPRVPHVENEPAVAGRYLA